MTTEPPGSLLTEGVRSLEVRWIFPGQLETSVIGWFARFPTRTESREDTYLLDPQLRGLSVKVRGGAALEVKAYRGSPGILDVTGRARGHLVSWQKWSFPVQPAQPGRRCTGWLEAGSQRSADQPVLTDQRTDCGARPKADPRSPGARSNSPKSARSASTGGPWDSRRPGPSICCVANSSHRRDRVLRRHAGRNGTRAG